MSSLATAVRLVATLDEVPVEAALTESLEDDLDELSPLEDDELATKAVVFVDALGVSELLAATLVVVAVLPPSLLSLLSLLSFASDVLSFAATFTVALVSSFLTVSASFREPSADIAKPLGATYSPRSLTFPNLSSRTKVFDDGSYFEPSCGGRMLAVFKSMTVPADGLYSPVSRLTNPLASSTSALAELDDPLRKAELSTPGGTKSRFLDFLDPPSPRPFSLSFNESNC